MEKAHCKRRKGLGKEAVKHTIDEAPAKGPVLGSAIIAQSQQMIHYGITGFGTVVAFAKALRRDDDQVRLGAAVKDIHGSDDVKSELANPAVNVEACGGVRRWGVWTATQAYARRNEGRSASSSRWNQ